ncbi:MAG TPA: AmmeMemoRadiSam system protein B [Gemmataceae bacterium]|nr:AmmeMemoRadiSam system protein B [Gemmataceae bacterium]
MRPGLSASRDARSTEHIYLYDTWRQSPQPLRLTLAEFRLVEQMNGQRAVAQLLETSLALPASGGEALLHSLLSRLENGLYLDGPSWQARLAAPVREPSCLGTYAPDAAGLKKQLLELFNDPQSSGLPDPTVKPNGRLRAVLAPHIDYGRGGRTYTWAFKELVEQATVSLFVIIGTSHYSRHRFTLTRKAFKTPLGVVPTDRDYIDRLEKHYGPGLFADEFQAHLPEHSIELEVVLLQYLMETRRPVRIVPMVVGSFQDAVLNREAPSGSADIERMMKAIVQVEAELPEPPAYIISGDLAHIGPKFGDSMAVHHDWLTQSRLGDEALINAAEAADFAAYADIITEEQDCRRICGYPPTYTLLQALKPSSGRLLHYDQYIHPQGYESVSFASMAFYR